jgi:hypothetical protein
LWLKKVAGLGGRCGAVLRGGGGAAALRRPAHGARLHRWWGCGPGLLGRPARCLCMISSSSCSPSMRIFLGSTAAAATVTARGALALARCWGAAADSCGSGEGAGGAQGASGARHQPQIGCGKISNTTTTWHVARNAAPAGPGSQRRNLERRRCLYAEPIDGVAAPEAGERRGSSAPAGTSLGTSLEGLHLCHRSCHIE